MPAGNLTIVDLVGAPAAWTLRVVGLTDLSGLTEPTDPEPEFVDISPADIVALTLQENNAVARIDLAPVPSWIAGRPASRPHAADLTDDDVIDFSETLDRGARARRHRLDAARQPDDGQRGRLAGWHPRRDDLHGPTARSSGRAAPRPRAGGRRSGSYDDGRSDNKGVEPEGLEIGDFGDRTFAFVAAERAGFVAVYRLTGDETDPALVQLLPDRRPPEGLLAIPDRGLFVTANEGDGTISIFRRAPPGGAAGGPSQRMKRHGSRPPAAPWLCLGGEG